MKPTQFHRMFAIAFVVLVMAASMLVPAPNAVLRAQGLTPVKALPSGVTATPTIARPAVHSGQSVGTSRRANSFTLINGIFGSGGNPMSSTNYSMQASLGEPGLPGGTTDMTSVNFQHQPGFLAAAASPFNNPVPTTTSISPSSATAGGLAFPLTVNGTNFVSGSVVRWNGSDRTTTFVSATQLTAAITAADIATAGTANVTVFNPTPGGGTSNAQTFTINAPSTATPTHTPTSTNTPTLTPTPTATPPSTTKPWTFMLYLGEDNNLYPWLTRAISNLEAQAANPNVNIVILYDGDRTNDSRRFLVQPGGNYTDGVNRWYLGELNMGDPQTLVNFVNWTRTNYPAQHYYLAIADHGRGTSGVAWDDTNNKDYLTTAELRSAFNTATNSGQWRIDVLHYDTCLMGMLENAYQVKDFADYLVASENLGWSVFAYDAYARHGLNGVSGARTPYTFATIVPRVNATTTPRELAISIADAYFNHPALQDNPRTIAAFDLSKTVAVRQALDTLATELLNNLSSIKTYVQNTRGATQKFDSRDYFKITNDDEYVDLYHLAEQMKKYVPNSAVQAAAQGVMDAITTGGFVIAEHHKSGMWGGEQELYWDLDNAHGVSLYFPPRSQSGQGDYTRYTSHQSFRFTAESQWDAHGLTLQNTCAFLGKFHMLFGMFSPQNA